MAVRLTVSPFTSQSFPTNPRAAHLPAVLPAVLLAVLAVLAVLAALAALLRHPRSRVEVLPCRLALAHSLLRQHLLARVLVRGLHETPISQHTNTHTK